MTHKTDQQRRVFDATGDYMRERAAMDRRHLKLARMLKSAGHRYLRGQGQKAKHGG